MEKEIIENFENNSLSPTILSLSLSRLVQNIHSDVPDDVSFSSSRRLDQFAQCAQFYRDRFTTCHFHSAPLMQGCCTRCVPRIT